MAQLLVSAVATVLAVAFEWRGPGFLASWSTDRVRLQRNVAYLVANLVVMAALGATTELLFSHLPALASWTVPFPLEATACVLVAELLNWVFHWVKHRQRWLWRFHLQHHVESRYDVSLTLHTHGLEVLVSGALMMGTLRLCGFSRGAVEVFTTLYYVTNLYKHMSWRASLGWLDAIIVSPAFHRVHHAKALDGNFGSVLTFWDVVFRTAVWPTEEVWALQSGTKDPEPFGFVAEMLHFLKPLPKG